MEALALVNQVVRGRWFMVFASLLIMSTTGAAYIVGIYSKDIKTSLGYNQHTLNTVLFWKDLGVNLGILSGLINEVTPPWVVLSIGAAMNLSGYLMIYLAITGRIARPAVWQMCLYIAIGANSQSFADNGAVVTCVKNFPESRGIVLGLHKGFVGLSGAIITQLYFAIYGDDSKSLVLLVAWLPAALSIIFVHTIRIMPPAPNVDTKPFFSFLYISLALAGYIMVVIIVEKRVGLSHPEYSVSAAVVVILLLLPLAVVIREEMKIFRNSIRGNLENQLSIIRIDKKAESPPSTQQRSSSCSGILCVVEMLKPPERGEDYSILQVLVSVDMLILFFTTICGVGGMLTAIGNMGQIGESLGYPPRSISTFVSLLSIWNYMGRVTSGFASEIFLKRYKFPRPLMLTIILLLSCVGHLFIAFGVPGGFYVASVIIGFCFGAHLPLLLAIISELFGLKYYSTLYNLGSVANPIGSYIFNVRVTGRLYDREAERQNGGSNSTCIGVQCFRLSFIIIAAVTVVGALGSMVLVWRTWKFYRGDIYARFRGAADEAAATPIVEAKEGNDDGGDEGKVTSVKTFVREKNHHHHHHRPAAPPPPSSAWGHASAAAGSSASPFSPILSHSLLYVAASPLPNQI